MSRALNTKDQVESNYAVTPIAQTRTDLLVEISEVSPGNWNSAVEELNATGLLTNLAVRWTRKSSTASEGMVTGQIRKSEKDDIVPLNVEAIAGPAADHPDAQFLRLGQPSFSLPFRLSAPLSCNQEPIPILTKADLQFADPKLRIRISKYKQRLAVAVPLSFRCEMGSYAPAIAAAIIALLAFALWVSYRYPRILRTHSSIERIPSSSLARAATLSAQVSILEKAPSSADVDELDQSTAQGDPPRSARGAAAMPVESTAGEDRNHQAIAAVSAAAATTSHTASKPVFDSPSYKQPDLERDEAERQQAIVDLGWALLEHRGSENRKWADLPSESAERNDAANEFLRGLGQRDIETLAEGCPSGNIFERNATLVAS